MEITKFPLDFDILDKGSVVPQSKIEEILDMKADDPNYWKGMLKLRDRIQSELQRRSLEVTIKEDHGDLVILMDGEASTYNYSWAARYLKSFMRSHERLLAVNPKNLTHDERIEHRKRIEVTSKYAQVLSTTTRTIVGSASGRAKLQLPVIVPKKRVI